MHSNYLRQRLGAGPRAADGRTSGRSIVSKGDKQHGNREPKKPKANKKAAPARSTFLKPQDGAAKPAVKPPSK